MVLNIIVGAPADDPDAYKREPSMGGFTRRSSEKLLISLNNKQIDRYAYLVARNPKATETKLKERDLYLIGERAEIIGFLYHEIRHYQQGFWETAYAELRPEDFFKDTSPNVRNGLKSSIFNLFPVHGLNYIRANKDKIIHALDLKQCEKSNHTKIGLKRMFLSTIYRTGDLNADMYDKEFPGYREALDKVMQEEFVFTGDEAEVIDYTIFADYTESGGYFIVPYEDDAFATQETLLYLEKQDFDKIVKQKKLESKFFHNFLEVSNKLMGDGLPRPTDHSNTYRNNVRRKKNHKSMGY